MNLKEDPKDKRIAVRFTEEADLSSLSPSPHGHRDPEEGKTEGRRAIEEAIAGQHEDDGSKARWPKAKDVVPDPDWKKAEDENEFNESRERKRCPDDLDDPSRPNEGYEWAEDREIEVLEGTPSAEQCWDICFSRVSRHMSFGGNDNTMASKINRMIRKHPMEFNEIGKEGWSCQETDRFGFRAYGPKCKLGLRGDCAGHGPMGKAFHEEFIKDRKGEIGKESTYAPFKGNASADQVTQISGSRTGDWCEIETNDNTFVTKIRKAAKGHPESWLLWRLPSMLIAYCPKGCLSFRG
jgi:hypothetical protein